MRKSGLHSFLGMGAVALAVILIILTITCFAVLTCASAENEERLSEKSQAAVTDYYQADGQANQILSEISFAIKNGKLKDFIAKKGYNVTNSAGTVTIAYSVPVRNGKELQVEAAFRSFDQVQILRWETTGQHQEGDQ